MYVCVWLHSICIARTTWKEFLKLLDQDKNFQRDEELQEMDPGDKLSVFSTHVRHLESKQDEMKERKRMKIRRFQRKNRDAFQTFLEELHDYGSLTSLSLWSELYSVISRDER